MPSLGFTGDTYGGKVISVSHIAEFSSLDAFEAALAASLREWAEQGTKGVWLHIPKHLAAFLPVALDRGFQLHHTEPDRIVVAKWLPDTPSLLPGYTTHTVGVGCFVVNDRQEVLAVQESSGPASASAGAVGFWKTPTGLVDGGEDLAAAAVREVKEETGIDAEVVSMVALREMHQLRNSDSSTNLYCVFAMRPVPGSSEVIRMQESEIAAAEWMPVGRFLEQATSRMPPGGVYYTLNALAALAGEKNNTHPHAWRPHSLPLGAKIAAGVSQTVYFDPVLVEDGLIAVAAGAGGTSPPAKL